MLARSLSTKMVAPSFYQAREATLKAAQEAAETARQAAADAQAEAAEQEEQAEAAEQEELPALAPRHWEPRCSGCQVAPRLGCSACDVLGSNFGAVTQEQTDDEL